MTLITMYAERLRAAGRSEATIGSRCRVLRRMDRELPQGLIGASGDELAAILAACRAAWTKSAYFQHLHGFYTTMVAIGRLDYDPTTSIIRPKQGDKIPNPCTDDELATALARSPDQPWKTAVMLAAYQGLRCAEVAQQDRSDITEDRLRVRVGKGGKGRYLPTHPAVWEYVNQLPPGRVVRDQYGEPVSPQWLAGAQGRHWRRIGLPTMHWHRFRHWFASTLVDQGVGIEVVCELMGHASVATTQGYVRVAQSKRVAAIRTLPSVAEPVSTRLGHTSIVTPTAT